MGTHDTLVDLSAQLREQAAAYCDTSNIPGYLVGVHHQGARAVVAHGLANAATASPMREDTGFLFGSVTKVPTATLVMQQVERGTLGLDDLVVDHIPEFRLATPRAAERIRVRHLLSHTNGIDADLYLPDVNGPTALQAYVEGLSQHCGALFDAGEYMGYSNGGMILAGRLLEVVTGRSYHDLLRRELYGPAGMVDSSNSAEEAILRSTAVGHFPDPVTGKVRRTDTFKLPDSWAPAGGTPIGSVGDLLAFGRTHLAMGLSPTGNRLLSEESAARMRAVEHDMHTQSLPPMGLGWPLWSFGPARVLAMSGASPGGVALLAVVPDHDTVFAAFGNDPRAMALHDRLLLWLLREHLHIDVPDLASATAPATDLERFAGTYRSNQMRCEVSVVDGQLEERMTYEPQDDEQARVFSAFSGGSFPYPARRLEPIGENLFAPVGIPLQAFTGYMRQLLISYHGNGPDGPTHRCAGGRMTRRVAA